LRELIGLSTADGDFDIETTTGDRPFGEWLGSALTSPFLSEKRTVVVRNVLRITDFDENKEAIVKGLKELPATAIVILVADAEQGDDDKQKRLAGVLKKWESVVAKVKGTLINFVLDTSATKRAVKESAESAGKRLAEPGLSLLVEMAGGSLSRSIEELEKLILYLGDEATIREADIRSLVVPSREWKISNLVRATLSRKPQEALTQLAFLFESFGKVENAAFQRILPTFARNLRGVWQARLILDSGARLPNLPIQVTEMLPLNGAITSDAEWSVSASFQMARATNLDSLADCFQILADTDARLKGVLDSAGTRDTLERMILEMASAVRAAEPSP
jgi:DNA polymerase-3 subunit delta